MSTTVWEAVFSDALEQGMTLDSAFAEAYAWEEWLDEDASDRLLKEWDAVESAEAAGEATGFIQYDLSSWLKAGLEMIG